MDEDRGRELQLFLSGIAGPRFDRLALRSPGLGSWPAFEKLFLMRRSAGETLELKLDEFDALASLLQLLNAESLIPGEVFDFVMDAVVTKIDNKGGARCDLKQVPDIAYEGQIALLFAVFMPGWVRIEVADQGRPDHAFQVKFYMSPEPANIAIECKNIKGNYPDIRDLIRAVVKAISEAKAQHAGRIEEFVDLIIFVDLPVGFISRSAADYHRLIVNVFRQLELQGNSDIDESQVIFTATGQRNMAEHLLNGDRDHRNLTLLRPLTVGKKSIWVKAPRMVFLSFLMGKPGEPANIENWSKVALNIEDAKSYLL